MSGAREAGRELDCEVAERVMGWEWCDVRLRGSTNTVRVLSRPGDGYWRQDGAHDERDFERASVPEYSTTISAAWLVVEVMRGRGWSVAFDDRTVGPWWAEFATEDYDDGGQETAATLSLAICLAALAAVGSQAATPRNASVKAGVPTGGTEGEP